MKPKKLRVVPSDAVAQIDALSKGLGYAPAIPAAQMEMLRGRSKAVPVEVINLLATLAEQNGGEIAGFVFDAAAARDALARAENARSVAKAARRLSKRATSDAIRSLEVLGNEAMAIVTALDRVSRNPRGENFVEANDQIKSLMRKPRTARKSKAKDAPTSTTNAPPQGAANVNAPGAPSTSLPS